MSNLTVLNTMAVGWAMQHRYMFQHGLGTISTMASFAWRSRTMPMVKVSLKMSSSVIIMLIDYNIVKLKKKRYIWICTPLFLSFIGLFSNLHIFLFLLNDLRQQEESNKSFCLLIVVLLQKIIWLVLYYTTYYKIIKLNSKSTHSCENEETN